ncbi:MAG: ferric reductase-like transmembrane domain-containing protein [Candidatus Dormibacteraeota bacterium]|nr:ferric reductase-like transmembrane domain-containing protein [Candidatus Dormibacteraeota bacterium]
MRGPLLVAAYAAVCLSPLVLVNIGHQAPRGPFYYQLSISLAYVGLVMLVLQLTLVSRSRPLAKPFGIEVLHHFHKQISLVALAFLLAHPMLLLAQSASTYAPMLNPLTAPWGVRLGMLSGVALVALVVIALRSQGQSMSSQAWKITHGLLAAAVLGFAFWHLLAINTFTRGPGGRAVVVLAGAAVAGGLLWTRLIRPWVRRRQPWRVIDVVPERGNAVTLMVRPEGHRGWPFMPGQFAFASTDASALGGGRQHPVRISSPSESKPGGPLAMTVNGLGGWARELWSLRPGSRLYLDGPHGSFSIDRTQAPGYVFIAGEMGVTPIYSMIATLGQRQDPRPVILFYLSADLESITFREQIGELERTMPNLQVVHVLQQPPQGWTGETGQIDGGLLYRNLPQQYRSFAYFICGAPPVIDRCEEALLELRVPRKQIYTERFCIV